MESWSCEDSSPVGPFGSEEKAVRTVEQDAVCQGFAVNIVYTRSRGNKRVFFVASKESTMTNSLWQLVSLLDRGSKTVCSLCEFAITFNKNSSEIDPGLHLNDCYFRHVRRINDIKLAARTTCATRKRIYTRLKCPDASNCSCCIVKCPYVIM